MMRLFGLLLALVLGGCATAPSPGPAVAAVRQLPGIRGTITIDPVATPQDIDLATTGIRATARYFRERLGVVLRQPIEIRLRTPEQCQPDSKVTGNATATKLCVWVGSPTWARLKTKPIDAIALAAHEHVHNFQGQLGCLPSDKREYRWFTEGMAVHLSWRALIDAKLATDADFQDWRTRYAVGGAPLLSLGAYAARVPGDRAYDLSARAVAELARHIGDHALIDFCRTASIDWRAAFAAVFGEPVEQFIARFDRANQLPEAQAEPAPAPPVHMLPNAARLLVSPMDEVPSNPVDAHAAENKITLAAWLLEESTTLSIRHIPHKCAGLRTFTSDRVPTTGFDRDNPGFFGLAGQGEYGLQTSPAKASATASFICNLPWPVVLTDAKVTLDLLSLDKYR